MEYKNGYKNGYQTGYKRALDRRNKLEGMTQEYSYSKYVIAMIAIFISFIYIMLYINDNPFNISSYKDECLLKLSSTYSGENCV